eukprot:CAMPEP_0202898698 /NCGR_PEP_ID=MMETSP1392-20130828/7157_1 /ASSEMBLY_ACC=CAM_ASM_000868 /TAXON_ID=225041 /ORGANISM="Chlamydomonas chlamydogama, Strain SAG 11-48b" /LENGTH=129 /DNA_ID=CAMNT_0049584701 /DNA_START=609 /DNA_END=995 /DNA_ORIENTATION=-
MTLSTSSTSFEMLLDGGDSAVLKQKGHLLRVPLRLVCGEVAAHCHHSAQHVLQHPQRQHHVAVTCLHVGAQVRVTMVVYHVICPLQHSGAPEALPLQAHEPAQQLELVLVAQWRQHHVRHEGVLGAKLM